MLKLDKSIAVLLLSISLGAAAAESDTVGRDDPPVAPGAEKSESSRRQFEKLINTYGEGLTNRDVDGILELYSSDPVFMPEYAPPAVGREAVRKAYEWVFATLKLNGRFIVHEAEVTGDTAWARTSSTGRFTVIATGVEADVANSELFLFKREHGAWKIHRYIFTASAPPPRATDSGVPVVAQAARLPQGFRETSAEVNGVRINYKIGGHGSPVVLLHGYAETSHMWIPLLPLLATSHTVIAPDLRGAGGSERTPDGYDKKTLAQDVRGLVRQLGYERAVVVGHDIGLMVAYAYAAQYPGEVSKVILMDAFLPGVGDWTQVWLLRDLWHFHFYGETPLALVKGRERVYFEHFWNDFAADKTRSVPEADRQLYAAAYARDEGMRAGFQYFKTFEQDAQDFAQFAKTKLTVPMLVLTGEKASGEFLIEQARLVDTKVQGVVIKGSGHWLMEEAPQQVIPLIVTFIND